MAAKTEKIEILTKGLIKENPVLVLILGTCPALAITRTLIIGFGMGVAATFVLLGSNILISSMRNIIPEKVRIPSYIVLIAGLVTVVEMLLNAYFLDLYESLGVFIPLIVVNCIILGRAEVYASKNTVLNSALDALGMGVGFTLALTAIGAVREIMGSGSIMGINILPQTAEPIGVMALAPGGFLTFAIVIAIINKLTDNKAIKRKNFGCEGCPSSRNCAKKEEGCQ